MTQQICSMWKKSVTYWVPVALTAALCFGFTLTNPSMGVDDESFNRFIYGSDLLIQGRFFSHYMRYLVDTYAFLPFWRDFLALVLMICGATGIGHAYQLFSGERFTVPAQTALVCVTLAFPYMAHGWIFMMTTIEIGYLYLVTALCLLCMYQVFLVRLTGPNVIGLFLLFLLASIISEAGTTILLTCGTATLTLHVLYAQRSTAWRKVLATYGFFLLLLAATMVLSRLIGRLVILLNGLSYTEYVDGYVLYDRQNLLKAALSFLVTFPVQFWGRALQDKALLCYLLLCVVLLVAGIRACIRRKSPLPFLAVMATALAPLGLMFVTGQVGLPERTLLNLGLATGLPAGLLLIETGDLGICRIKLRWLATALIILLVVNLSRSMNRIFYEDALKYQRDKALMESVITDLREANYNLSKPVVFLGLPDGPEFTMGSPISTSIYVWDRVYSKEDELESGRIIRFYNAHGYPVRVEENFSREQLYTQAATMPSYPAEGYIKDWGSYVVIRLGEPGLARYTLSRDDFLAQYGRGIEQALGNLEYGSDQAENFSAVGWAGLAGVDSDEVRVSVCLISDSDQYVLRTERIDRNDVTAYFNSGVDYDRSGFTSFPVDLRSLAVRPGVYSVMLWLHGPAHSELLDTQRKVVFN